MFSPVLLVLLAPALLVAFHTRKAIGGWLGAALGVLAVISPVGAWYALERQQAQTPPLAEDMTATKPVTSETCYKCHESHYTTWHDSYHRTMTREATPENVKADFNNAVHHYQGVTSSMTRRGDRFYMDTVEPVWATKTELAGISFEKAGPPVREEFTVSRIVGSHWFQQFFYHDERGRYFRLPLAYHLVEKRWIHVTGAFLMPPGPFYSMTNTWNDTCLYCHNTRPSKNPQEVGEPMVGYRTTVGELGIGCEACHGSGERHVRAHQNPARRLVQRYSGEPDPTIINPARLSVDRSVDVCARCHGGVIPKRDEWNRQTDADPYLPGRDLGRFWHRPFAESELNVLLQGKGYSDSQRLPSNPHDGRCWGDGTPLTTAMEYQGMSLSACYQGGHGKLTCLNCHAMHGDDPNHQVKSGMRTNEACTACHQDDKYRSRLAEHTHHAADSSGSLCYNCHMPYQMYSLLDVHRSHRISIPRVRDSLGTGKPHACNLCHLDKSLGWTQEHTVAWYPRTQPEPLSENERTVASSVLLLAQNDARTRGVVAGAFAWPPAQEASGRDWPAAVLLRVLEHERYDAVRYSTHKSLRSLYGAAANAYDFQGLPRERAAQVRDLHRALEAATRLDPHRYPYLPITSAGRFADDAFNRLLQTRNDPDVNVKE